MLLLSLLAYSAFGHGVMIMPPVDIKPGTKISTEYIVETPVKGFLPDYQPYNKAPYKAYQNAEQFAELLKASSKYSSIRDIIRDINVPECGFTVKEKEFPISDIEPANSLMWQNTGNKAEGFTPSHAGPCEAYLDDKLVWQDDDCSKNYPGSPAVVPDIDYSSCGDRCVMEVIWFALHPGNGDVQIYVDCVTLLGNGGGDSGDGENSSPTPSSPDGGDGDNGDTDLSGGASEDCMEGYYYRQGKGCISVGKCCQDWDLFGCQNVKKMGKHFIKDGVCRKCKVKRKGKPCCKDCQMDGCKSVSDSSQYIADGKCKQRRK